MNDANDSPNSLCVKSEYFRMLKNDKPAKQATRHNSSVAEVAKLLCQTDTCATLSRILNTPKPTVRSWVDGSRRMPITKLNLLDATLKNYYNEAGQLIYVLGQYIKARQSEPPRKLSGCCAKWHLRSAHLKSLRWGPEGVPR